MSAAYVKAVYSDECRLDGTLKPLAACIAHIVLDDKAAAKKTGLRARTLWSSVNEIADMLNAHPMTVRRQLHRLRDLGVLTVLSDGGGRKNFGTGPAGVATTYEFHPEALLLGRPRNLHKGRRALAVSPIQTAKGSGSEPLTKCEGISAEPLTKCEGVVSEPYAKCEGYIGSKERSGSNEDLTERKTLPVPVWRRDAADTSHDFSGAIARCITAYSRAFARCHGGTALVVRGKDGKLLKALLGTGAASGPVRDACRRFGRSPVGGIVRFGLYPGG
jgi:hypothetical protein